MKKTLALILALSLVLTAMSGIAFAAETTVTNATELADAIAAATSGDVIVLKAGTYELGTIKLPTKFVGVTIRGEDGAILKDTVITNKDASTDEITNFTIDNIKFDNSRIYVNGWTKGMEFANWTITNCEFVNLTSATSIGGVVQFNLSSAMITGAYGPYNDVALNGFTFTNNVIDGAYCNGVCSGINSQAMEGTITITGNTFKNIEFNAIQMQNVPADAKVTINNNSFESTVGKQMLHLNNNIADTITIKGNEFIAKNGQYYITHISTDIDVSENFFGIVEDGKVVANENYMDGFNKKATATVTASNVYTSPAPAKVGNAPYFSIDDAIAGAKSGDTILLVADEYDAFTIPKGIENITIKGANITRSATKPVINIKDVTNGGVKYQAKNVTFENVVFDVNADAVMGIGYYPAALGFYVEDSAVRESLTLRNCDFVNNSSLGVIAVMAHLSNYSITNCTFENFATGVSTMVDNGRVKSVTVSDNTFANVTELVGAYWGAAHDAAAQDGVVSIVNNKATDGSTTKIGVHDFAKDMKGADATAFENVTIKNNDAKVVFTNYDADAYTSNFEDNANVVYNYTTESLLNTLNVPEGKAYIGYGSNDEKAYLVIEDAVYASPDTIEVKFEFKSKTENEKVYDIKLVASSGDIINRLNSVDLDFAFTQGAWGNNDFEIIASNSEVAINPVDNSKTRYEFHYNGKTDVSTDTATEIIIGQVKFTGYGVFEFAVNTQSNGTNAAHATKVADNIVDTFIPGGTTSGKGELIVENSTTGEVEIKVPTRTLTINITFPNAVENKGIAYQDMKVVISGGDLAEEIEIDLGSDAVETALEIFGKEDAEYVATFANDAYKVIVTDVLTVNNAYTVTVSGAGYRTARYTVTMTGNKELNFWNNVMDEEKEVEVGKDSSKTIKNFLAGDIVKDNQINIYDLSAVVSYFATTNETDKKSDYAKYDLNRDGVIDSKDVAYVLVSWKN